MTYHIPLIVVELENDNYHILVEIKMQDDSSTFWVIDTGASRTVMDSSLAHFSSPKEMDILDEVQSAGINGDPLQTQLAEGVEINIGNCKAVDLTLALIDLENVNQLYEKYTDYRISGLIGSDLLQQYQATIDYSTQELILRN
ncbi:hypothetical protein EMN47_06595 [Prolixibacteraceae bacterium JC049]|nr:hypothetical protein [Prolixibacteraceae bacterium JC049]